MRLRSRWERLVRLSSALALIGLLWGCGDNGGEPELTAEDLTAEGWVEFETGDYGAALSTFEQAIGKDSEFGEAYNGAGWCCICLDSLERAMGGFDAAISNGVSSGDPRAGKAVVHRDLEPVNLEAAISWADSALSVDSQYVFSHHTDFDWHDLRLIIAHSYFELARYDEAKAQIDILNPANTLDPASPAFVEDLLAELQRLGEEF